MSPTPFLCISATQMQIFHICVFVSLISLICCNNVFYLFFRFQQERIFNFTSWCCRKFSSNFYAFNHSTLCVLPFLKFQKNESFRLFTPAASGNMNDDTHMQTVFVVHLFVLSLFLFENHAFLMFRAKCCQSRY